MRKMIWGIAGVMILLNGLPVAPVQALTNGNGKEVKFTVRIENISSAADGQAASNGSKWPFALSPGMYVVFDKGDKTAVLFNEGKAAPNNGLESQAEDGHPDGLIKTLDAHHSGGAHGFFNTPAGANGPGPIGPGGAYEFTFTAKAGQRLMVALMFGQSNDLFYAPDKGGIELFDKKGNPVGGDVTSHMILWDGGTEVNQEEGIGTDQAPRQKAPNTGASENGVVHKAKNSAFYNKTAQLFRVTVTPKN